GHDPRTVLPLRAGEGHAVRASMAFEGRTDSARSDLGAFRTGRVRAHHSRTVRRRGPFEDGDVRGLRRAFARLYRRGIAGDTFGNRSRTDPHWRDQGSARLLAAQDRKRREIAN